MKLQLKAIWSPDHDMEDLEINKPKDLNNFCILIQTLVGPEESEGSESFSFIVCSSRFLEEKLKKDNYIMLKHYLVIEKFDLSVIKKAINDLLVKCTKSTWEESAECLSQYAQWEFEDYKEAL